MDSPITNYGSPPPYHPCVLKQWVKKVISFSSQYNNTGWSADQVVGSPKVYPEHGDLNGAWASGSIDKHQFIELEFEHPVTPSAINIYETYNPGGVIAIKVLNLYNKWELLWQTHTPEVLSSSRIFSPPLKEVIFSTNRIRLDVDCTAANSWCEIDAVELVGLQQGAVAPVDDVAFIEEMKSLINNTDFSDVKLLINNEPLHAHRGILAARSSFFKNLFRSNQGSTLDLELSISYEELFAVMTFIYTNRVPQDCPYHTLITLYEVSSVFELPELKTAAMHRIISLLNCENVIDVFLRVKDNEKQGEVKSICMQFMASHLKEMSRNPAFETLPPNVIVKVVQEATMNLSLD
ncbi:unnamed protein product [Lymnaea stagnalis]|uniref:BTB domain-containing protein n=1 Tax=Lymnaea stagnalis TaxID=6523 RepID=A0AAV2I832_LYMST